MTEQAEQLRQLAKPFPAEFVKSNPSGGGTYVTHGVVTQRLLYVVGPYDFHLVQIVRGYVDAVAPNPNAESKRGKAGTPAMENVVVGAVCRLTVTIDGRETSVEEVGDCEQPSNWPHDGARMKDAMSDALKRCAMRLGLGLHLWSKADQPYKLYGWLTHDAESQAEPREAPPNIAESGEITVLGRIAEMEKALTEEQFTAYGEWWTEQGFTETRAFNLADDERVRVWEHLRDVTEGAA